MGRAGLNPNVDVPPAPATRRADWASPAEQEERQAVRDEARAEADALDNALPMQQADARREVPRQRTDHANPNMTRSFPAPNSEVRMLSSRMKKSLSKAKRAWVERLPKTRRDALQRVVSSPENIENVNRALHHVVGRPNELPPALQRRIRRTDAAIQDAERDNPREHLVYSVLKPPKEHGNSRNALVRKLREMSSDPDAAPMTFDGYIPGTHSLGNIGEGPDVVMLIRTRSGAYLGTSDTTPDADHIVSRGRSLRPVGVHEMTYVKPDGTRGNRVVAFMDDVTPAERTTAKP